MKRLLPWLPALLCVLLVTTPLLFAASNTSAKPAAESPRVGAELASTLTQVTGVAISPLLGVSALGAYKYFTTPEADRAKLPWYCQMKYWSVGLLIVAAVAFKDASGAALPPGWKKPLDIAETLENKLSGLVAAGAFIPFTIDALSNLLTHTGGGSQVALPNGLAMLPIASMDWSWLLNILLVPFAIALFGVVWLASHAINVLILISPWGAVDAALKSARLGVLGLVTLSAQIDPWLGILCSVIVIVVSYLIAGWSFRLSVFGWIFCWDALTFRRTRFTPAANENWVFSGDRIEGVPIRTYGRVSREADGKLVLNYRPWLFLPPKKATLPEVKLAVGRGAFYPTLEGMFGEDEVTLLTLPPRYMTHEAEFARACGVSEMVDVGLRRAWGVIKELFGFESQRRQKLA